MPQKLLIIDIFAVPAIFGLLRQLVYLRNLQLISSVGGGMRIFDVVQQQFVSLAVFVERGDSGIQFEVVGVEFVDV